MSSFSSLTTRLGLVSTVLCSAALLSACQGADPSGVPGGDLGANAAAEYLFGMTEEQLLAIYPLVADRYAEDAWLEANQAPFDCARYGDMCRDVGPDAVYDITERSYRLALDGATLEQVDAFLSEELDAAALAWREQQTARGEDERDSAVFTNQGGANQERVRLEVFANKPALGTWHGKTDCTYQVLNFGAWGGSQEAWLTAYLKGHIDPGQYDQTPAGGGYAVTATIWEHSIVTTKMYFYPVQNTDDLHIFGKCDASNGGWSASASGDVTNF